MSPISDLINDIKTNENSIRVTLRRTANVVSISLWMRVALVNNPETKELFEVLNPFLKLPDQIALREDPVGITLIFDGWTVNNYEQLLAKVPEGAPFYVGLTTIVGIGAGAVWQIIKESLRKVL
uniref:Uncharacterized protein n=1 Tax=Rhizophagus irregularis (strain DAOM 181602 / DAOM 197198 / MUCL 43194) TaxID=747089 RepID=U9SKT1_RHIID